MNGRQISWISLWASLLEEAVEACVIGSREPTRSIRCFTTSIILARTSWESFTNELVQQRGLSPIIKQQSTRKKLSKIVSELEPGLANQDDELLLASAIRNSIIHQDTKPLQEGESPRDIVRKLSDIGVIECNSANLPWEQLVISARVAGWCCNTVGQGIVRLEMLRGRQFRPPHIVTDQVNQILKPLRKVRIA